ncbi:metal ABC transporter substrate-binding protein [Pseudokineococcus marinus]|uniref:Zinc ABC transporter substrate-binding protein n=1 Tax=Pseudokineococcus marinus TaxID=351215 RepID=A0A849BV28_9ACTN|nr:metal ABC transporter substrate-binding protein [Pseudokineococcus marinus]NNH23356.1 zinc ABC transporter substrate-binding protein [Pseudokineococcus marinus]
MTRARRSALLALPAAAVLALTACGSSDAPAGGAATDGDGGAAPLQVAASFYPLQWVTQAVAGDRADVTSLTQPGTEPHDLELSPQEVATAVDADVLVTLQGFQGAVDAAADERGGEGVVDVAPAADLEPSPGTPPGEDAAEDDHEHEEGHDHEGEDHEGEDHEGEEGHDHGLEEDPHFWLDPVRMSSVAEAVADGLADADPDGADVYAANLADVRAELADLDAEYSEGLATCDSRDLVTAHQAFGYLAERYDLVQRGVSGIGGEQEPGAARLAEVAQFAEANGVRTIYTETLLPADVAETVAAETGATTAVLDTLEGLTDESPGDDYPSVMRADLETLRQGQGCS